MAIIDYPSSAVQITVPIETVGYIKPKYKGVFTLATSNKLHHWLLSLDELIGWIDWNDIPTKETPVIFQLIRKSPFRRGRPSNIRLLDIEKVSIPDVLLVDYAPFRRSMSHKRRWEIIEELVLQQAPDVTIEALINEVSPSKSHNFWASFPLSISTFIAVAPFAPASIKQVWFDQLFPDFAKPMSPNTDYVTLGAEYVVRGLSDRDKELAKLWAGNEDNKAEFEVNYTRMLSARAAEKAVALFFRKLRFKVEDVAIKQLRGGDDWKTYDLLVAQQIPVDVKNSRTAYNNPNAYVEHTVPRFKFDRNDEEVRIAGVVSPYLSFNEFEEPTLIDNPPRRKSNKHFEKKQITFLGITKYKQIAELEKKFKTAILNLRICQTVGQDERIRLTTIPPWIFDYPDKYYQSVEHQLDQVRLLDEKKIPTAQIFSLAGKHLPLAEFLAANRKPPNDWLAILKLWQREFVEQLLEAGKPTLPVIFLTILKHFSLSVRKSPDGYDPAQYKSILDWGGYPLGRRDPLKVVNSLCNNLDKIWRNREVIKLNEFESFYYQGLGILQGQRLNKNHKTTLIAYCGGYTEKRVKCGNPDLILGSTGIEECPNCHHLVCPLCGFCSRTCVLCKPRQEKFRNSPSDSDTENFPGYLDESSYSFTFSDDIDDIPF